MVKVLVSLDDHLLRRVDERARELGLTRSAYLARVAREDLPGEARSAAAIRSIRRARKLMTSSAVKPADATTLVRALRDER